MKSKSDYLSDEEMSAIRCAYVDAGVPDVKTLPDSVYASLDVVMPPTEEGFREALEARIAEQDVLLSILESYRIEQERCSGYLMDRDRVTITTRRLGTVRCHIGLLVGTIQKMTRRSFSETGTASPKVILGINNRLQLLEQSRDETQQMRKLFRIAFVQLLMLLIGGSPGRHRRHKTAAELREAMIKIIEMDKKIPPQEIKEIAPEDWAILRGGFYPDHADDVPPLYSPRERVAAI